MRKRLIVLSVVGLLGGAVRGDAMYWLLDQSASTSPVEFQYAQMIGNTSGNAYYTADSNGNKTEADVVETAGGQNVPATLMYVENATSRAAEESFYFALYNDAFQLVAKSGIYDFSNYENIIWTGGGKPSESHLAALAVTVHAIPEPTGGVLVLLGVAALALRRRRGVLTASEQGRERL